jgi:hypothetical protein
VLQLAPPFQKQYLGDLAGAEGTAKSNSVTHHQSSGVLCHRSKTHNDERHGCEVLATILHIRAFHLPLMPTWKYAGVEAVRLCSAVSASHD